jgi:hypothetical protein
LSLLARTIANSPGDNRFVLNLTDLRHIGGGHQSARRPRRRGTLSERFSRYAIPSDSIDGCWQWSGSLFQSGYGAIAGEPPGKSMLLAHRVSYRIYNGPIPTGMCCLHKCDNRRCVNPSHLSLGSRTDNHEDMVAKGRHRHGDNHHWSKLSQEQADLIRAIRSSCGATMRDIADLFGVSRALVSLVLANRIWVAA